MSRWFDCQGYLKYSPKRLGDHVSPNWWLTAQYDNEVAKYFRKLYELSVWRTAKLMKPAWDAHVTIIRNEEPPLHNQSRWEMWPGQWVWTRVYLEPETNGEYYWFPVYCPAANVLRRELGLGTPSIPYHLSFGRVTDEGC